MPSINFLINGIDNLIEGVTDDMPDTITDWQTDADKRQMMKKHKRKGSTAQSFQENP